MEASLGLLIRLAFGTMFLAAGSSKLSDLGEFAEAIKHYRLIPGVTAGFVARVVAIVEVTLGVVLLVGVAIPVASVAGSALLIVFALAMAINLFRGRRIDCGCKRGSEPIQIKHILRNSAGVAALVFLARVPTHPWAVDAVAAHSLPSFPL
ncbi:MAG: MauE/DoxX family redox-associated membrane protein [Actinomycetota bacterium]